MKEMIKRMNQFSRMKPASIPDDLVEVPTTKQLIVIRIIEENTPHRFEKTTKQEAAKFISTYIEESRQVEFKEY